MSLLACSFSLISTSWALSINNAAATAAAQQQNRQGLTTSTLAKEKLSKGLKVNSVSEKDPCASVCNNSSSFRKATTSANNDLACSACRKGLNSNITTDINTNALKNTTKMKKRTKPLSLSVAKPVAVDWRLVQPASSLSSVSGFQETSLSSTVGSEALAVVNTGALAAANKDLRNDSNNPSSALRIQDSNGLENREDDNSVAAIAITEEKLKEIASTKQVPTGDSISNRLSLRNAGGVAQNSVTEKATQVQSTLAVAAENKKNTKTSLTVSSQKTSLQSLTKGNDKERLNQINLKNAVNSNANKLNISNKINTHQDAMKNLDKNNLSTLNSNKLKITQ